MLDLSKIARKSESKYGEISNGFFELKKSKFYAYIFNISAEEEIDNYLNIVKKDNKKAKHILYAYEFFDKDGIKHSKFSNDGEPQGTGVNSVISMLEKEEVSNYLVIIVRYFGGTLLGAGPLLRSYLSAFKDSFEKIKQKF